MEQLCEPEVHDLRVAVGRDEDVRGLDVAMDDARWWAACRPSATSIARSTAARDVERLPVNHRPQVVPLQQLHHDERPPGVLADLVDGADARIVQRRGDARLAPHPIDGVGMIGEVGRQQLQRHRSMEPDVLGSGHDPMPPRPSSSAMR